MLPRTLFGRLLLVFMLFGIVMTGVLLVVMQVSHRLYHLEFDQTVNRDLARDYVEANFLLTDAPLNAKTLHRGIRKLAAANPQVDIYLLNNNGQIVAASLPPALLSRSQVDMGPVREFLAGRPAPVLGDDPRDVEHRAVFSAAPFDVADCPGDVLYLVLRRDEHQPGTGRLRTTYAVGEGAGVILVAAALSVALSLWFLRLLTRRLGALERAILRFRDANGVAPPRLTKESKVGGDEIDRLEGLFGELADRIEVQMRQLRSTDLMRRELLANVSHDLRTPLTTLLAHLETLQMKQSDLSAEDRREYIEVATRQGQRIGRLVEQLLEAARLEAGQIPVTFESFPVGELLQDVVQKFALTAASRHIELSAEVAAAASTQVRGDIALLERVLDNLIDNALRYTPEGGSVTVAAEPIRGGVRVTVRDTGCGMTAEEAARIFDRFYRGDPGRSSHSGQAGLGLAIVKSILDLHGTPIVADSQPGEGTSFSFELPHSVASMPIAG